METFLALVCRLLPLLIVTLCLKREKNMAAARPESWHLVLSDPKLSSPKPDDKIWTGSGDDPTTAD